MWSDSVRLHARGFSLIEIAVALVIMGFFLGSILIPLNTQVEESKVARAEKELAVIKEALLGFAAANGHLPCPDSVTSNDGLENVTGGFCNGSSGEMVSGNLPWATLGLPNTTDPWGNRYRYTAIEIYARRPPFPLAPFTIGTQAINSVRICTTAACTTEVVDASVDSAVAIVLSHGRNGYGAINALTDTANPTSTSADEAANSDGDKDLVYRTRSAAGSTAGEFDDVVTWLSRSILMGRMIAAGKLP